MRIKMVENQQKTLSDALMHEEKNKYTKGAWQLFDKKCDLQK